MALCLRHAPIEYMYQQPSDMTNLIHTVCGQWLAGWLACLLGREHLNRQQIQNLKSMLNSIQYACVCAEPYCWNFIIITVTISYICSQRHLQGYPPWRRLGALVLRPRRGGKYVPPDYCLSCTN